MWTTTLCELDCGVWRGMPLEVVGLLIIMMGCGMGAWAGVRHCYHYLDIICNPNNQFFSYLSIH